MSFADPTTLPDDLIKDGSDAGFMADVIEQSRTQPVLVDFWATWCGPCRTLTPMIEKAVRAAGGAVKLVKIDVDKNPAYAGQLRVQSIPTVYAFVNGQPVDGFQGAVPDSQLKAFIDKLTGGTSANSDIEQLMGLGEESLTLEPAHDGAIAGMARVYLADGDVDQARQTIAMAPQDSKDPTVQSVRAQLSLMSAAPSGVDEDLRARVAADPTDHQARYDLSLAQAASGDLKGAVDSLLAIVAADREWNDQAARKQLLVVFDAAGAASDVARDGRRRLSSILFA